MKKLAEQTTRRLRAFAGVEKLETRQLLSTMEVFFGSSSFASATEGNSLSVGVSAFDHNYQGPYVPKSITVNYTLSGPGSSGSDIIAGGSVTVTWNLGPPSPFGSGTIVLPIKRDNLVEGSEAVSITITPNSNYDISFPNGAGPSSAAGTTSSTITDDPPIVSLAVVDSSGTESATGESADPLSFNVHRSGGDPSTPISVTYDLSGGASAGTDYNESASGTVSVGTDATISVTPKDDPDAEGVESVIAKLSGAGSTYLFAPALAGPVPPPEAQGAIDDNASVSSIVVEADGGSSHSYGYGFAVVVTVKGEHLDQVQIKQTINASTSLTDYNGANLTRAQVLAQYPDSNPSVVDSDGNWETDEGWDWGGLDVTPDTKNGEATKSDSQLLQVPGAEVVALSPTTNTQINWLAAASNYFKLETRKVGGNATLRSFDWGYQWNNYDAAWSVAAGAPHEPCVASHRGSGQFAGIQGITGLE